jgi:glycosyltransferase involved in cell wall biosynthesis
MMGVQKFVEFVGWIDFKEVPSYMTATDVGVLPQIINPHTENTCAHKVFQYMTLGKPVVTTPTQVYKQINDEKEFALFVPYEDTEALCGAILQLYKDIELRSRLGKNGQHLTKRKYDWNIMGKELIQIYKK